MRHLLLILTDFLQNPQDACHPHPMHKPTVITYYCNFLLQNHMLVQHAKSISHRIKKKVWVDGMPFWVLNFKVIFKVGINQSINQRDDERRLR